jgi:hypothetical protein
MSVGLLQRGTAGLDIFRTWAERRRRYVMQRLSLEPAGHVNRRFRFASTWMSLGVAQPVAVL